MKPLLFILFFIGILANKTQDSNIIGTWNIIEFTMTNGDNVNKSTKEQLIENKSVWDLYFKEDGTLKQTSNMRTGESETQEGTWKITDGNLVLILKFNNRDITIKYDYELKNETLTLKRGNPMGTMDIETKFKKKELKD